MAWIETVPPPRAQGTLKDEYDRAVARAGRVFQILQISSLDPEVLHRWVALYEALMHGPSPLSRAEREMVATTVSRLNDCHY